MTVQSASTPLPVIALVSRVVATSVDRITGDRSDFPLLVSLATQYALNKHQIGAQVFYGPAAWIEILENDSMIWAGCWGQSFHFWVGTQFGEIVDLNTSVAHRKRSHSQPELKAKISPPLLWSREVPKFYRYHPEGIAEVELQDKRDIRWLNLIQADIDQYCRPDALQNTEPTFINEPLLAPGRRVLDDSAQSFRHFDRVLATQGIPQAPF